MLLWSSSVAAAFSAVLVALLLQPQSEISLDAQLAFSGHSTLEPLGPKAEPFPEPEACSPCPEPLACEKAVGFEGVETWVFVFVGFLVVSHVIGCWILAYCRCRRGSREAESFAGGRAARSRISENGRARRPVHR